MDMKKNICSMIYMTIQVIRDQYFVYFQIRLNFLPVGHTHEDIDAFFGVYSKHLAQMDIYTIEGEIIVSSQST